MFSCQWATIRTLRHLNGAFGRRCKCIRLHSSSLIGPLVDGSLSVLLLSNWILAAQSTDSGRHKALTLAVNWPAGRANGRAIGTQTMNHLIVPCTQVHWWEIFAWSVAPQSIVSSNWRFPVEEGATELTCCWQWSPGHWKGSEWRLG